MNLLINLLIVWDAIMMQINIVAKNWFNTVLFLISGALLLALQITKYEKLIRKD